jgi:hypothetical protein
VRLMKRLVVWFVETLLEVLLLGLALTALFGHDQHAFGRSLVAYASGIVLVSFTTGYMLTTAVARVAWRGQTLWSYSAIAVALFLIHSEVFFVLSGGSRRLEQLSIQMAGSCIVLACTLAGTFVIRNWVPASNKLAALQP